MGSRRESPLKTKQRAAWTREGKRDRIMSRDDGVRRMIDDEKIDPIDSGAIRKRSRERKFHIPKYLAAQLEAAYQARLAKANPAALALRRSLLGN